VAAQVESGLAQDSRRLQHEP